MLAELLTGELFTWNLALQDITNTAGEELFSQARTGAGWDLVRQLLSLDAGARPSVHAALLHPYFTQAEAATAESSPFSLAASFSALQGFLASLRDPKKPSEVIRLDREDDHAALLAALQTLDLTCNVVVELPLERRPFSEFALLVLDRMLGAESPAVEPVAQSLVLPRDGGGEGTGLVWAASWPSA